MILGNNSVGSVAHDDVKFDISAQGCVVENNLIISLKSHDFEVLSSGAYKEDTEEVLVGGLAQDKGVDVGTALPSLGFVNW